MLVALGLLLPLRGHAHAARRGAAVVATPQTGADRAAGYPKTTDRLIVRYRCAPPGEGAPGPLAPGRLAPWPGVRLSYLRPLSGGAHVLALGRELPLDEAEAIARRLAQDPDVVWAEADRRVRPVQAPDDPLYGEQWNLGDGAGGAGVATAWGLTEGAPGIVVAVLDTGILADHPDLVGRVLPGYDFVWTELRSNDGDGRDADPSDPGDWADAGECGVGSPATSSTWHGTHLAGIIGAVTGNAAGVAGINRVSKILPVRTLGKCGGFNSDVVDGIRWAVGLPVPGVPDNPHPARVVNLSLAMERDCPISMQLAINDALAAGAVVVAGVGNDGADAGAYYPANCEGVIAVGATTRAGSLAAYSNRGATVDLSAPGGSGSGTDRILSTLNTGTRGPASHTYGYRHGTSMAAAHVSAVASLLLSVNPELGPAEVLGLLQETARPFPDSSCTTATCGAGIVDAGAAVSAAAAHGGNHAPTAVGDFYTVIEDGALTVAAPGVLANDSDPDGDGLEARLVTDAGRGTLTLNSDGSFAYAPAPDFNGSDGFAYSARDPLGGSNVAQVTITVAPVNDAPVLGELADRSVREGELLEFTVSATDPDGTTPTLAVRDLPEGATFSGGVFRWTPGPEQAGSYTVTFIASDRRSTDTGTVRIAVEDPVVDRDGDGLPDELELATGTDPFDADTDDDGLADGGPSGEDRDGDGAVGPGETDPRRPDTDGDGIYDGTERGQAGAASPDTDPSAGHFVADADPASVTDPLDADTDDDGLTDGHEDRNADGRVDLSAGETDPGDPDTDGDGVYDGTESGLAYPQDLSATNLAAGFFIPDQDPRTTTDPGDPDTDGDGALDGEEDLNRNGRVDAGETNPNPCRGDLDEDGSVDGVDLWLFVPEMGRVDCAGTCLGDLDGDEDVDSVDLALLIWEYCYGACQGKARVKRK
ncbi:MAG: hypothetical protein Kow0092_36770 [Deferrisomatales bacterium]